MKALYRAAYREGDPFSGAPPLNVARHGSAEPLDRPPLAAVDNGEFFGGKRFALPPVDGALWLRKAGKAPQRPAPGNRS